MTSLATPRGSRWSLPLTFKLPLIAAGLMILVGLAASHQVFSTLTRMQDDRLREIARLHMGGLAVALGPSVLRRDVWEVFDTLDRAMGDRALSTRAIDNPAVETGAPRRFALMVVTDADGRVIASSDPRRVPIDHQTVIAGAGVQRLDAIAVRPGEERLTVAMPLTLQERVVGHLVVEFDVADILDERARAISILVIGNALVTGALALAGYLAMRRMLRPITVLANHIAGQNGLPLPIRGDLVPRSDPDLARLFETYNQMSAVTEAKAEVERRMAERERFVGLGRLASSLAHEINNPLGGLLNATDTLVTYADRPDVVRQSAKLIERGIRHLRDVARAILDQHRFDAATARLSRDDFEDLRLLIEPECRLKGQTLTWSCADLPADLDRWPAAAIRQMALNLVLNAAAAADTGGQVSFQALVDGNALVIKVTDTGPGLGPAAWVRLMTDDPLQPGGGVGLRMVRDLVGRAGGTITVDREAGLTTITLALPAHASRGEP
jgi:signal transduction histidine kinase